MQEKYYPPPQTTPTFDMFEIKNQNKGIEDYIGYRFPLSLIYYLEKPPPI